MKKIIILGAALFLMVNLTGCSTTDGNANLRNANSNTAYVTTSPTPMATSTPMTNSMPATNGYSASNANRAANTNSHSSNLNANANMKANKDHD